MDNNNTQTVIPTFAPLGFLVADLVYGATQTPASLWANSDHVSKLCREFEVEELEEQGFIIGGLS